MRRWKKAVLALLALVFAAGAVVCVQNRNNLAALYLFVTSDSQTIEENLGKKREEHQEALQEAAPSVTVTAPTTEQSNALLSGQVTPEEVKQELGISEQLASAGDETTAEEIINLCVMELYACKIDLMARLAVMKQAAVDEWNSLAPEERTETARKEIGMAGLSDCYELEAETDEQVQEILQRYRTMLEDLSYDTSIMDDLWGYYEDEKAAEKAYYLDKYLR